MVTDIKQPSIWKVNHNGDTRLTWRKLSEVKLDNPSEANTQHQCKITDKRGTYWK